MATKKRKLLEDPEDINQSCSNRPSRDGIVSSKRCYLCRLQVSSHAVIDLNNKSSESLKRSLEHVFEVCFKNELVCYPCRNEFESSISQMMQFKNKHLFNSEKVAESWSLPRDCLVCGCSFVPRMTGQALEDQPELRQHLLLLLHEPIDSTFCTSNLCNKCFRMLTKINWMRKEISRTESYLADTFEALQINRDLRILMRSDHQLAGSTADLFIEVKEVILRDSVVVPKNIESDPLPAGMLVSSLVIDELNSTKEVIETMDFFSGKDYPLCLSMSALKKKEFTFALDDSLILFSRVSAREEKETFNCEHCLFGSRFFHVLFEHLKDHLNNKPENLNQEVIDLKLYKCHFCGKEFNRKSNFKSHNLLCKPDLPAAPTVECNICNKMLKSTDSLAVHIARDHENSKTPWTCSFCQKGFTRKASYEEHISRHKGIKDKYCVICDKYFYETAYWRHNKMVHPSKESLRFSCDICKKKFSQQFKLKQHLHIHLAEEEKTLSCQVQNCNKMFANLERLKSHIRVVHSHKFSQGSLVCGECGATYNNYNSMCGHIKRCHDPLMPRPLPCPLCPQTFSNSSSLNKHKTSKHPSDRLFFCGFNDCKRAFSELVDLHRHQETGHNRVEDHDDSEERIIYMGEIDDPKDQTEEVENMEDCVNDSTKVENLDDIDHLDDHSDSALHESMELGRTSESIQFEQSTKTILPDLTRREEETLATVLQRPEQPEYCQSLGPDSPEPLLGEEGNEEDSIDSGLIDQFENKADHDNIEVLNDDQSQLISNHLNLESGLLIFSEETGSQLIEVLGYNMGQMSTLQCATCTKTFTDDKHLECHECSPDGEIKCPACMMGFKTKAQLVEHKKVHVLKRFICNLCSKPFSTKKVLKRHMRIHTGERPYECEYCLKKFGAASNLSEHRTLHTGRMAYSCDTCDKKFRLWSSFNKHRVKCVEKTLKKENDQETEYIFVSEAQASEG